jgi:amidase
MMNRRRFIKNSLLASGAISVPFSCRRTLDKAVTNIIDFSAVDLSTAIKSKEVSCVDVMKSYLSHIHHYNPTYNAIISMVDDDILLSQAKKADEALARGEYWGWMHGMPHAIKDLGAVKDLLYTEGSLLFKDRIANEDSAIAAKIRNQGAIFIGKTNTPEFGLGSQSYNSIFGATGSAYNPALTSGGSSGGAACGLGTHMLPVAEGGDMMGSLRNPGAFNNVIGFRPSTTVIMEEGDADDRLLWTSGPMGRDTRDTIQLLQTLAINPVFDNINPIEFKDLKIGWLGNLNGYLAMENGILDLCDQSLKIVSEAGSQVQETLPNFQLSDLWYCWTTLRHHIRLKKLDYYEYPDQKELLKPELLWEIEQGLSFTQDDVLKAEQIRSEWYKELDRLFDNYDFLVLPSAQVFPYSKTIHWPQEIDGRKMDTYHRWMEVVILASLGGIPVINLPVGFDSQGRPMGMQVMGKFGDDRKVLEFALAYEQITNHLDRDIQ